MYGEKGHGRRGGRFTKAGAYYSYGPVRLKLKKVRYAEDLAASVRTLWDRRAQQYRATLRVSGKRRGVLRISWPSRQNATAQIGGKLGGRVVRLRTPGP